MRPSLGNSTDSGTSRGNTRIRGRVLATLPGSCQAWRQWLRDSWTSHQRKVYDWIKRTGAAPDATSLNWGTNSAPGAIPARVARAVQEWGTLWAFPRRFHPQGGEGLPALTLGRLDGFLARLSDRKACGPDHWRPAEIRALPEIFRMQLLDIYHAAEARGTWPPAFAGSLTALIPKEGARHEGQLRPIGLLPYAYRIWMGLRRQDLAGWLAGLYEGQQASPVELAGPHCGRTRRLAGGHYPYGVARLQQVLREGPAGNGGTEGPRKRMPGTNR